MANTEILKTLQLVRNAKAAVNEAMESTGGARKNALERLSNCLENVEGDLIASALAEKIAKLQGYEKQMASINSEIKQEIEDLEEVADKVDKAAKALGILIGIIGQTAALAGL